MARAQSKAGKQQKPPARPWELRLLAWLALLVLWHLPRLLWRLLAWLVRRLRRAKVEAETADQFYRSYRWRRLRIDVLEENREVFGALTCECCGSADATQYHVDHIYPRASHPELALEPDNLQVLCDACNVGKGIHYTTNWRGGAAPRPGRSWLRFWAR